MEATEKVSLFKTVPFLGRHVRAFKKDGDCPLWCLEVPRTRLEWLYGILLRLGRPSCLLDLDAIGSQVISRVGSGMTIGEILSVLETAFPEEKDLAARLSSFIMHLHKKGVLELTQGPSLSCRGGSEATRLKGLSL